MISRRFRRYLIFYRVRANSVEVLTILHGARDLPNLPPDLI
ncbi:MAG: type II toxin-antitoxin system RelE/ParE family toxin [Tepidisphaeraceae bacterium]